MTQSDQKKEDEVLKRMLAAKPKPHKPVAKRGQAEARPRRSQKEDQSESQ